MNRLLQFFSVALITGFLFDLSAIAVYSLWSVKFHFPFLFEILLTVLILRDLPQWRLEKIAIMADRRFTLKDRLYSHLWYSRNTAIPARIRSAQLEEAVRSIDFNSILRSTRVRVPMALVATIPLFVALLYLSWNAQYMPPGITTRITSLPNFPMTSNRLHDTSSRETAGKDPSTPGETKGGGSRQPGREDHAQSEEELLAENRAASLITPDQAELLSDDGPAGTKDPPVTGSGSGGGSAGGMKGSGPENLISNPVSTTASAPVPPNLAADATQAYLELPDASKFLDLIPGQGSGSLADLDEETISIFEENLERFPDRYREQLNNYYWELKKWSLNQ